MAGRQDRDGDEEDRVTPLDGLVVLDFTRILAGPLATMLLSDLGADVIKVERPGSGDDTRTWGPPFRGKDATYFLSVNRGKRSVALDLVSEEGRDQALRLAERADVVVENFRSGVMDRLGLGYDDLRAVNPRLVYCSVPAFARVDTGRPGYDLLMQAACGLMSVTGEDTPVKAGVAVLDVITGLYASNGILAALAARTVTGQGQHVTVGLYEASLAGMVNQAAGHLLGGAVPGLAGNAHPSIVPYQLFEAADGALVLAAGNDKLFRATCLLAGLPELADDPRLATNTGRVAHREELVGRLQEAFSARPVAHWVAACAERGVPASPVRTMDEVFEAPEAAHSTFTVDDPVRGPLRYVRPPITLSGTPLREDPLPPPQLGEHDAELLDQGRTAD